MLKSKNNDIKGLNLSLGSAFGSLRINTPPNN